MPKEPITNTVFNVILSRLRAIKEGDTYFCSPTVYSEKRQVEHNDCPAIVVYQRGETWRVGTDDQACGQVEIEVDQNVIICIFHTTTEKVNRLKADAEKALFVGGGYLLKQTATDPAVTYKLGGPLGTVAGEGLELGDAQFLLTAFYKRTHGTP